MCSAHHRNVNMSICIIINSTTPFHQPTYKSLRHRYPHDHPIIALITVTLTIRQCPCPCSAGVKRWFHFGLVVIIAKCFDRGTTPSFSSAASWVKKYPLKNRTTSVQLWFCGEVWLYCAGVWYGQGQRNPRRFLIYFVLIWAGLVTCQKMDYFRDSLRTWSTIEMSAKKVCNRWVGVRSDKLFYVENISELYWGSFVWVWYKLELHIIIWICWSYFLFIL